MRAVRAVRLSSLVFFNGFTQIIIIQDALFVIVSGEEE